MNGASKWALSATALALAAGFATAATAQQPLAIVVRPGAPVGPPPGVYDPEPAARAAVGYTPDGWGVVEPPVLKQTGPRYANPSDADWRRPVVLRRGSPVPGYVATAPVRNFSVPGMAYDADYEFFVSPQDRVVFVHPTTRQVVQIVR